MTYDRGVPTPRFSVVIAAFNAERTITAAVDSALSQTTPDVEVMVVDDGSVDGTAALVGRIPDARVRVLSQANQGQAAARNAGVGATSGKFVGFLDADDLWLPDYLELAGEALDRIPNAGFAYTDAFVFDDQTGRVRRQSAMYDQRPPVPPPATRTAFLLELLSRNFVYVSTVVPRTVLLNVGGYTESLRRSEDYGLSLRILMHGYEPACVPGKHALYRVHPDQMSKQKLGMAQDALAMFKLLDPAALPSDAHREMLAHRIDRYEQEIRVLGGDDPMRHRLRALRHRLGPLRRRLGLAYTWYRQPPTEVAAAFPNLKGG